MTGMRSGKRGIRSSALVLLPVLVLVAAILITTLQAPSWSSPAPQGLRLISKYLSKALQGGGFYYETAAGRISLPVQLDVKSQGKKAAWQAKTSDGRTASVEVIPDGDNYSIRLSAQPANGIT